MLCPCVARKRSHLLKPFRNSNPVPKSYPWIKEATESYVTFRRNIPGRDCRSESTSGNDMPGAGGDLVSSTSRWLSIRSCSIIANRIIETRQVKVIATIDNCRTGAPKNEGCQATLATHWTNHSTTYQGPRQRTGRRSTCRHGRAWIGGRGKIVGQRTLDEISCLSRLPR
jgi:hypothetical protein